MKTINVIGFNYLDFTILKQEEYYYEVRERQVNIKEIVSVISSDPLCDAISIGLKADWTNVQLHETGF